MIVSKYFVGKESGRKFIRFSNADGKRWIVPLASMKTALNLYQPSGIKGKLVKYLLPYLNFLNVVKKLIHAENLCIDMSVDLKSELKKILKIDDFEFSVFEGTPSVHQKMTIQISQGSNIRAYCKVTESTDVATLFTAEQRTLTSLHDRGVEDIPRCLFCGRLGSGTYLFVQSTTKTNKSKVVHEWTAAHMAFLSALYEKTMVNISFKDTDLSKSLARIGDFSSCLVADESAVLQSSIEKVRSFYGDGEVAFGACHSDFTPWNMFFEDGRLFVFDFEYAGDTYPAFIDAFHYFTQTCIFEKRLDADGIFAEFERGFYSLPIENDRIVYTAYLLNIISLYLARDNGNVTSGLRPLLDTWISLLKKL